MYPCGMAYPGGRERVCGFRPVHFLGTSAEEDFLGFDVGKAMRGVGEGQRPPLARYRVPIQNPTLRAILNQRNEQSPGILSSLSAAARMGQSLQERADHVVKTLESAVPTAGSRRAAMGLTSSTGLYKTAFTSGILNPSLPGSRIPTLYSPIASEVFRSINAGQQWRPPSRLMSLAEPWSLPPGLASLTRPRIGATSWLAGSVGNVGLANSVAESFRFHGLDSFQGAAWNLRQVRLGNNPGLRALLKNSTIFGPIVVRPDYEDDAPFDYHPDLRDVIPETDSSPEEGFDVEEYWAMVVAFDQGLAYLHHAPVLVNGLKGGARVVFRIVNHHTTRTAAGSTLSTLVGHEIGGLEGVLFTATVTPYLVYLLTQDKE